MSNAGGKPAPTIDDHIFRWFSERHPDLMAECLKDYPDDDPAYAALLNEELGEPSPSLCRDHPKGSAS